MSVNDRTVQEECFESKVCKSVMLEELEKYDWIEQMKLKCQVYIHNNGIKTTTADELVDYLKEDAIKSFPKDVFGKCEDVLKETQESLYVQETFD